MTTRFTSLRLCVLTLAVLALLVGTATVPAAAVPPGPDTTPPVITCSLTRTLLWPARGALMPMGFSASATDDCDGTLEPTIRVYSDQGHGAAPLAPDAVGTTAGASTMRCRAERAFPTPPGTFGRVYIVSVSASDAAGNTAATCKSAVVPLYPSGMFIIGTRAKAATGEALCVANDGVIPPGNGYVLLHTFTLPPPIKATPDSYNCIGNVRLDVPAASGVLANDATTTPPNVVTTTGAFASAGGGDVVMSSNGAFTYDPPAGFNGVDTFTYSIMDGAGLTAGASVTINVADMIWFIDNTAAPGGDGRQATPFDALADLGPAADAPGDVIFVDRGTGTTTNYNSIVTLLTNQMLIGEGVDLATVSGLIAPPFNTLPTAGLPPVITNSTGPSVVTVGGNVVAGLDIGGPTGSGISASGTDLTVTDVQILTPGGDGITFSSQAGGVAINNVLVSNAAGQGFNLSSCGGIFLFDGSCSVTNAAGTDFRVFAGDCAVTYDGDLSQSTAGGLVTVLGNHSTGAIVFQNGTIGCTSGTGIRLGPCSNTNTFSNAMSLTTTGTAIGLTSATGTNNFANLTIVSGQDGIAGGGGTLNVTGTNSINATGGEALELAAMTLGMTFSSLTCTTAPTGISLVSCSGSLAVTGLTDINSTTSDAILVITSPGIDLDFATIDIDVGAGGGIDISGGVLDFDVTGQTTIDGTGAEGIRIAASAGNTFTFADTDVGLTTACASGVSLTTSAGATFTFADLDITCSNGDGLFCDDAGTLNIAAAPAINATGGAAIDITNTDGSTNGSGNFEFASPVSTNSGTVGIRFDTTSEIVLLTDVDIDSNSTAIGQGIEFTDCTGATKTVRRGHIVFTGTNDANGVLVDNSDNVTIESDSAFDPKAASPIFANALEITGMGTGSASQAGTGGTGHHAIASIASNGLTVNKCYIHAIGDTTNADALLDAGVWMDFTTSGAVNVTDSYFDDIFAADALHVGRPATEFSGTSTINFTGNKVVGDASTTISTEAGVQAAINSTVGGTVIGNFDDNEMDEARVGINVQIDMGNVANDGNSGTGAGGRNLFSASNNMMEDLDLNGISFDQGDDAVSRIIVDNNVLDASVDITSFDTGPRQPIEIEIRNDDTEAPVLDCFVRGNTIKKTNAAGPIWSGSGIKVETAGACTFPAPGCPGTMRVEVSTNSIGSIDDEGIELQADEGNTVNAIVRLNDVDHLTTVGSTLGGIDLDLQGSSDPATMRAWLDDNDSGSDSLGYDIDEPAAGQVFELVGETGHGLASPVTTNANLVLLLNFNGNTSDNGLTSKVDGSVGSYPIIASGALPGPSLKTHAKAAAADYVGRSLADREELTALLEAAKARWIAAGLGKSDRAVLRSITLEVARLEDGTLARSWFTHIIVDPDAAGYGWFIDASPEEDAEFSAKGLRATRGSDAHGAIDLLTVLMHEIGHVLGRKHCDCPGHVMTHDLVPGARRLPAAQKRR